MSNLIQFEFTVEVLEVLENALTVYYKENAKRKPILTSLVKEQNQAALEDRDVFNNEEEHIIELLRSISLKLKIHNEKIQGDACDISP